jgi:hypothetical protein
MAYLCLNEDLLVPDLVNSIILGVLLSIQQVMSLLLILAMTVLKSLIVMVNSLRHGDRLGRMTDSSIIQQV